MFIQTEDIISLELPGVAKDKEDKGIFILKCSHLQKMSPELIPVWYLQRFVSSLTCLSPIPVGKKSNLCHNVIRAEPHPQLVAVGHQDRRPCGAAEFTNQGRRLIASIPKT